VKGTSEPLSALWRDGRYALAFLSALILTPATGHAADEITFLGGSVSSQPEWPASEAWSFAYRSNWASYFSTTLSYLNDGHFPGHHRDGITAEIWPQVTLFGDHLTLAVGGGPFYYYDTTVASNGGGYADAHGWAWLYSGAVILHTGDVGPFFELRYDHTAPAKSIATSAISFGVGYRMTSDFRGPNAAQANTFAANEVTGFYGKTEVNSLQHPHPTSRAFAAEFRHRVWNEVRVTASFINEGDAQLIRRNGFTYEGWLEPSFFNGVYSVGVGFGGYSAIDKYRPAPGRHVSDVVSLTMSYQLVDHLAARFNWHRIVTDYNRDTDIVLFALGVRF
jgi:hypothetical protein